MQITYAELLKSSNTDWTNWPCMYCSRMLRGGGDDVSPSIQKDKSCCEVDLKKKKKKIQIC